MRCYECGNRVPDGQGECTTCHAPLWALGPAGLTAPASPDVASRDDSFVGMPTRGSEDIALNPPAGPIAIPHARSASAPVAVVQAYVRGGIPFKDSVHGRVIIAEAPYSEHPDRDICKIFTRILWIILLVLSPIIFLYWLAIKVGGLPALLCFVGLFLLMRFVSPTNLYAMFRIFSILNPSARESAVQVPVRYFRIREEGTDAEVMVRMKGQFTRGNIGAEDIVTLSGRSRGGTLYAQEGYNHRTSSTIRLARSYSWVGMVLTILLILSLATAFYEPTVKVARTINSIGGVR